LYLSSTVLQYFSYIMMVSFICGGNLLKSIYQYLYKVTNHWHTVKPAHAVTCIKRSPFSFSFPVIEHFIQIEPLFRGHLSHKSTFSLFQSWPLNTGLTVRHKLTTIVVIISIGYKGTKHTCKWNCCLIYFSMTVLDYCC